MRRPVFKKLFRRSEPDAPGFSEAAMAGLADLDARLPPAGTETVSATSPKAVQSRLSANAAAGGGFVTDDRGNHVPHYWGHRERLRTRFLESDGRGMPEYEVLELLLFNAVPRIDVKPLAKRLLAEFGDLPGVISASKHNLLKVSGATDRVHFQLRLAAVLASRLGQARVLNKTVLSTPDALVEYCRIALAHRSTEQFRILFLDAKNVLMADEEQAAGTVDHVPVYPREVAKRALELGASAIILVHNHPSGDTTPSQADQDMTLKVEQACHTINVRVHEHLIVSTTGVFSFKDAGYL